MQREERDSCGERELEGSGGNSQDEADEAWLGLALWNSKSSLHLHLDSSALWVRVCDCGHDKSYKAKVAPGGSVIFKLLSRVFILCRGIPHSPEVAQWTRGHLHLSLWGHLIWRKRNLRPAVTSVNEMTSMVKVIKSNLELLSLESLIFLAKRAIYF